MKQGTVSVLCGIHSPIHSLLVLLSWRILYGEWPRFWEAVCIFLHDVGHCGLQYLDSYEEKRKHWRRGAQMAGRFFGEKGYTMVAGHDKSSGFPESPIYKADKYSWHIAPWIWLYCNCFVEPKVSMGYSAPEAIRLFRAQVKRSVESGEFRPTHEFFLERCEAVSK